MSVLVDMKAGRPFLGTWRNTNPKSTGMAEVEFAPREGGLTMRVDGDAPIERFEARAEIFADDDAATMPEKIMVFKDLEHINIVMHGWVKQGVLVLAIFREFKGTGGRSNYFDREFFYRVEETC